MCRLLFLCCSVDELVAYAVRVDFDCKVDLVVLPLRMFASLPTGQHRSALNYSSALDCWASFLLFLDSFSV